MTKKRQPALLDPSGNDLPSPLFSPRPGWGGQLRQWLRDNYYALGFRLVLLTAIVLVAASITKERPEQALEPTPSATPVDDAVTQTAVPGDTLSHLAARALDVYLLQTGMKLDAPGHLWAVDRLVNAMISMSSQYTSQTVEPGQTVRFPTPAIEYAIMEGQSLSPGQRAALSKYLR